MIQNAFNDDFYKKDSNLWDSIKDRQIEEAELEAEIETIFDDFEVEANEETNSDFDEGGL